MARKLTQAQQTQRNIEGLLIEALMAFEDAAEEKMQNDGGWADVVESWNAEYGPALTNPEFVTVSQLTPYRVKRALKSKAVQATLQSILRGTAYNVRVALRNQPKDSARSR